MKLIALTLLALLPALHAGAQTTGASPLEISADNTLEWQRLEQTFTANGNAIAKQDNVSIRAEKLTAAYDENKESGEDFDIHTMTATDAVTITSDDNKVYGDKAVYDLKKSIAIVTGSNLRLVTPEQKITARDQFEYHVDAGKLIAKGNAKIIRPTDTLAANTITAFLSNDANGKRTLDRMNADGGVTITTATEKITGTYGTYNARTETAEITGGVIITRGPNILKGDRATVDLKTQISRIFGGASDGGRVSGTFYPKSEKK